MSADKRIFDHILIIVFENEYRSYVMNNPYFRDLAKQGIDLANHFGNMHPSQTNYVSSIAGELCNITYDWPPYPPLLPQRTVVDLFEEAKPRLRWKGYLQGNVKTLWRPDLHTSNFSVPFPVPDELWAKTPEPFKSIPQPPYPFAYFHNPFFAFERIMRDRARFDKVQDEAAFWRDLCTGDFPEFAWFSPDLWNDGHYLYGTAKEPGDRAPLIVQQADWLKTFFAGLRFPGPQSRLPPRTLVVVTYDEADFDTDYDAHGSTYDGPNQVYTVLLGDMIKPGVRVEGSNHYSMLKTVEKNFGLPSLGKNDADSNWWQFLWNREFGWQAPEKTPIAGAGAVAAAALGRTLYVVHTDADDALQYCTFDGKRWSKPKPIGATASDVALTAHRGRLILVYKDQDGGLSELSYAADTGWSATPNALAAAPVGAFSLATIEFNNTAMLAYADSDGALYSLASTGDDWGERVTVGHKTGGALILAVLGPSLYLIHKAVHSDQMKAVSYNVADFNIVTIPMENGGPASDTTKNAWSPSEFPVAYYWHGPAPRTPSTDQPLLMPYVGGAPYAAACLDGVIHLAETLSLSGVMTPKNPVSWVTEAKTMLRSDVPAAQQRSRFSIWAKFVGQGARDLTAVQSDAASSAPPARQTSNGFGTLAEAGWSVQYPIAQVRNHAGGGLAMARLDRRLVLLSQPKPGGQLYVSFGEYIETKPGRANAEATATKRAMTMLKEGRKAAAVKRSAK
jgi:hypothetical protein